ncbi:hypothetical protein DCS_03602 [Drechmeria coniospora]|uniref:Myb-like domain-containing protein n=1 Tax=Drechmeria coniospora TaxID=98403 RepID=A0A151GHS9_DRECN|nr:hypothetical protein DCS_03602 [Drechmeria coniospora]KYK56601.1 hypothetical protein DCS_03602 [Drechmeria coniospora]ODA77041.1 hypothetical protein RJ55_07558 [Drechmeria coniospora]
MSRTQVVSVESRYSPMQDAARRHESGVSKVKKAALSGSGRAWREDEEAYLLQTRLQKMPYKHIAAHLNKTELACRLHYHQLSHGNSRRKRANSFSSRSSSPTPGIASLAASPVLQSKSRSHSPAPAFGYYMPMPTSDVQLPRIMSRDSSPRLPAMLPKADQSPFSRRSESPQRFPPLEPLPPVSFRHGTPPPSSHYQTSSAPFGAESFRFSPPSTSSSMHTAAHVDLARLGGIYEKHRVAFWAAIADEYGSHGTPKALEQAWKSGSCCPNHHGSNPMTPVASPPTKSMFGGGSAQDKTRISAILD